MKKKNGERVTELIYFVCADNCSLSLWRVKLEGRVAVPVLESQGSKKKRKKKEQQQHRQQSSGNGRELENSQNHKHGEKTKEEQRKRDDQQVKSCHFTE